MLRAAVLLRGRPLAAHGVALALTGLALWARFAVDGYLAAGFPFLTFFPAIVLSTFFCGRGPAVVSAVLSVLSAWYWFIPPHGSFALTGSSGVAVAFFVGICVVDIVVIDLMLTAHTRLATLQRRTDELLAERTVLFQELQHRVANNLMLMGAVLADQERRLSHLPQARDAVGDARRRFDMLSRLHRQLHDPDTLVAPIQALLPGLCADLVKGLGRPGLVLEVNAQPLPLGVEPKLNLCLLVMELLTNAAKHAFGERDSGRLWVHLSEQPDGQALLCVDDDGCGPGAGFEPAATAAAAHPAATAAATKSAATAAPHAADAGRAAGDRLGMRIATGLSRSLRGELTVQARSGGGTSVQVRFKAPGDAARAPVGQR
ncbi:sensor histidine kinase [Aquabacterium sp. OR-4]|uniref:sensor histidine kinase n=1 Tax=Aquabacterium sp. OR-4 TaxID=2978127 RepID=UPI0028C587F3|nr:DUF4118 domain-containing protein [Aquabacterium sp. OR-4]MDT7835023.1 DUF4118 domain-containing protein [Aquabacterium sp. OR-4]